MAKRLTLKAVNKAIAEVSNLEMHSGQGYFYFTGHGVENLPQHQANIYVYQLNDLSLEQYVDFAKGAQQAIDAHFAWEAQFDRDEDDTYSSTINEA